MMAAVAFHQLQRCSFGAVAPDAAPHSSQTLHPNRRPVFHPRRVDSSCSPLLGRSFGVQIRSLRPPRSASLRVRAAATAEKRKAFYPGEKKGFIEEMRLVAMKLHRRDQADEGQQPEQVEEAPLGRWQPSIQGYLKFLVDSKVVYDAMESIVNKATHPAYAEFRNTGLERSAKLAEDLEWFETQGHKIPEPGEPGMAYAKYLSELADKDPPAFICHFYNVYFAHTAGGRMIGKKVAEKILDGRELEFYKWDGDLSQMMATVREKLNKVADGWTREEKNRCLQETEKSFKNSGKILRLIIQ